MKSSAGAVWQIRKGMDRRFRAGHPWVYSNELVGTPKGVEPGSLVELRDAAGRFLARGFGNPNSLISFRALSRDPEVLDPSAPESLLKRLQAAGALRKKLGLGKVSHRLCFGESDFLPGLVVDCYQMPSGQVFVAQAHTAGADRWVKHLLAVLESMVKSRDGGGAQAWERTSVVLRNDVSVRKLEGLAVDVPQVLKHANGVDLRQAEIWVLAATASGGSTRDEETRVPFEVDLVEGQKTGFFLDQAANIELAVQKLRSYGGSRLKILDLCCYVGQWGTQLGRAFAQRGIQVEVVAVDASKAALELAKKNMKAQGVEVQGVQGDVLKDLTQFSDQSFDLVISDPPAFIKSRKDTAVGAHAYLQLATQVFRVLKKGGGVVSCSCSALFEEEVFAQTLAKAALRNQRSVSWIGRGGQALDHPVLAEFPEGRYLKAWVGVDRE
ncbi:MAG: class I SAM-dependent rRNA methyltransferase [Bdellovibrionia bacterium]